MSLVKRKKNEKIGKDSRTKGHDGFPEPLIDLSRISIKFESFIDKSKEQDPLPDIYSGDEKIPFDNKDAEYIRVMLGEFVSSVEEKK